MINRELTPLRSVSKSREVFEQLRRAIWSGSLPPGTPLREAHIARQMNVSQVPVREALFLLEHIGLVLRVPDHGTTVTKLTFSEIKQMTEVREHLEIMAFQHAAQNLTSEVIAELRGHLKEIKKQVAAGDQHAAAEEDFAFHKAVWAASGNDVLAKTLTRLCVAVYAFVILKRKTSAESMASSVKSHRKLLEILLTRDSEKIAAGLKEHLATYSALDSAEE